MSIFSFTIRNVTINYSLPLGKSSWEAKLRSAVYLVSTDSEQGKPSCLMHPSPYRDIPADIHVCGPGYPIPLEGARDSLPAVAPAHQLLIGTSIRSAITLALVSTEPT